MKNLSYLSFGLKRRLFNKMTIGMQFLFIVLMGVLMFADQFSQRLNMTIHQAYGVRVDRELVHKLDVSAWNMAGFDFTSDGSIELKEAGGSFFVSGTQDVMIQAKLYELLLNQHQTELRRDLNDESSQWIDAYQNVSVIFEDQESLAHPLKMQVSIMLITSIYFMMINFIAVNAGEIIMEKTSNMMPIFLSCMHTRDHFMTKLLAGLASLCFQLLSNGLILGMFVMIRNHFDKGVGLVRLLRKYVPMPIDMTDFSDLVKLFELRAEDIGYFMLALILLVLSIFCIQVIVLTLSSRVKTVEEAGAVQAPFYFGLLMLYYLSLSFSSYESIAKSGVRILSSIPILGILLMPMRVLYRQVNRLELSLSLGLLTLAIILIIAVFYPLYARSLRDDS